MAGEVAALDRSLAGVGAEWVTLRRVVGEDTNIINVDVKVRARVDAIANDQNKAGLRVSEFSYILSPTQINEAQWPGGVIPAVPPVDVDQSIPRINSTDQILQRGEKIGRTITFCDPRFGADGEVIRLNLRAVG